MEHSVAALVIDPCLDGRILLKNALQHAGLGRQLVLAASFEEAKTVAVTSDQLDPVFISHRLPEEGAASYLKHAKALPETRDAAFVITLSEVSGSTAIGAKVLEGYDGCLLEPFSVNALEKVILLAAKIKIERRAARLKLALRLLVQELIGQFEDLVALRRDGAKAQVTAQLFRESASILKELDEQALALYYEILYEELHSPGVRKTVARYRGASERVRARLASKSLDKVRGALRAAV